MALAEDVIGIGTAEYAEVLDFLHHEARLLDNAQFYEWIELLADDIDYRMPVRLEKMPKDGPGFIDEMTFYTENKSSLVTRIKRLQTEQAWAEQPGSRQRHFLTNSTVRWHGDAEYEVVSNFLTTRTRSDLPYDFFTGERQDLVRRRDDGSFELAKRRILLDQTVLLSYNLSVFL